MSFVILPDFKRGDSFLLGCIKKDADGVPEDLTNITIRSHVRDINDELAAEAIVTKADQTSFPGEFVVAVAPATTGEWEPGPRFMDIEFSVGEEVASSQTLRFKVVKDMTHA